MRGPIEMQPPPIKEEPVEQEETTEVALDSESEFDVEIKEEDLDISNVNEELPDPLQLTPDWSDHRTCHFNRENAVLSRPSAEEVEISQEVDRRPGDSLHPKVLLGTGPKTKILQLECVFCDKKCVDKADLKRHLVEIHHAVDPATETTSAVKFKCQMCDTSFGYKKNLSRHVSQKHQIQKAAGLDRRDQLPVLNHNAKSGGSKQVFPCPICTVSYSHLKSLSRHMLQHDKNLPRKIVLCKFCSMSFTSQYKLTCHLNRHSVTGLPPIKCLNCDGQFSDQLLFDEHITYCRSSPQTVRARSFGKGMFTCLVCSEKKLRSRDLAEHILGHRTACRWCYKQFSSVRGLGIHTAFLHKEKHFKCKYCPDLLKSALDLHEHITAHRNGEQVLPQIILKKSHPISEHQPHGRYDKYCDSCSMSFHSEENYLKHIDDFHGGMDESRQSDEWQSLAKASSKPKKRKYDISPNLSTMVPLKITKSGGCKSEIRIKIFSCSLCSNSYKNFASLEAHCFLKHGRKNKQDIKLETKRYCHLCHKSFQNAKKFSEHLKTAHVPPPVHEACDVHCSLCNLTFKNQRGFKIHNSRKHTLKSENSANHASVSVERAQEQTVRPKRKRACTQTYNAGLKQKAEKEDYYFCEICDSTFLTPRGLMTHKHWHGKPLSKKNKLGKSSSKPTSSFSSAVRPKRVSKSTLAIRSIKLKKE